MNSSVLNYSVLVADLLYLESVLLAISADRIHGAVELCVALNAAITLDTVYLNPR